MLIFYGLLSQGRLLSKKKFNFCAYPNNRFSNELRRENKICRHRQHSKARGKKKNLQKKSVCHQAYFLFTHKKRGKLFSSFFKINIYFYELFQSIFMLVSVSKLSLSVIKIDLSSLNKGSVNNAVFHVKNISLADNNVGVFSFFQSSGYVINT